MQLTKHHGLGNDFLVVLDLDGVTAVTPPLARAVCDRHRGIGADGLIAVEGTPEMPRMRYYNADGGEAEMCGNGARCFARYAANLNGQGEGTLSFLTQAGPLGAAP